MRVVFEADALEDLNWWMDKDRKTGLKVLKLISEIRRDPLSRHRQAGTAQG